MSVAGIAYAGYQLIAGYQQAEMVRINGQLAKQAALLNAKYAEIDAWNAERDGYSQAARYQSVIDSTAAAQTAAYAAQGVDTSFGTAADVARETQLVGFLNTQDIVSQAHAKAMGIKREARQSRMQGSMAQIAADTKARSIQNAALIQAGGYALQQYKPSESTNVDQGLGGTTASEANSRSVGYRMQSGF